MVYELRHLKYEQRLAKLELTTLKVRRERGDLIEFFKITNDFSSVVWHNQTLKSNSLTSEGPAGGIRGHQHRMTKQLTKTKQRDNFLINRVVNSWNELPDELINAQSKNCFKNQLNNYLKMK
ncbi:RNA-directed DNA polymerase from mobile element jockey-like [Brachionus plicatilis]|uniref:RNA-directed DNA polymerase from mobile element jockey-like n=1 Tax=Brachionus plicatilis TaxID=10195 RepID=A0A3M7QZS1_BRAPC|nr:RNA-directed DNA polymerase from mobile element jockey-like [Brachionus plicatilis]